MKPKRDATRATAPLIASVPAPFVAELELDGAELLAEPVAEVEPELEPLEPPGPAAAVGLARPDTPDTFRGLGGADADAPVPFNPPSVC
jgi:hypothetical protein